MTRIFPVCFNTGVACLPQTTCDNFFKNGLISHIHPTLRRHVRAEQIQKYILLTQVCRKVRVLSHVSFNKRGGFSGGVGFLTINYCRVKDVEGGYLNNKILFQSLFLQNRIL